MRTLVTNGDFPESGLPQLTFEAVPNHKHEVEGLSDTDVDLTFGVPKSARAISNAHQLAGNILNQIDLALDD
jgi:hypothetical protein